ncbi:hypothetical protein Pmani_004271 [Petrolisthes manimaculis]|uniref:Uncharacterized protein n=1 Tax=Petrolisthes manimaculis TaxID=1843537 RepID=A0AAE1ULP6_9EUCA|nr:hypothetical protein Pmani_004271 [Petrolisthes manimaculis]
MCTTKPINDFLSFVFGWLPARVALGIMSALGFMNLYMVRVNLSILIVAMVGGSGGNSNADSSSLSACHVYLNSTGGECKTVGPGFARTLLNK